MNSLIGARSLRTLLVCAVLATPLLNRPCIRRRTTLAVGDEQAELRDIVEEISAILGTTVVLDPRVSGRVTVMSRQALDREGVRRLFYSVLDAHGFT